MSRHGRILRPRQLFPEYFAVWIQFRRGLLRLFWWFGGIDLWMPPWATAAATGTVGIMLAILLFFLRGPGVSASPVVAREEVVQPAPVVPLLTPVAIPVPAPLPELTPSLQTKILRTELDEYWDQYQTSTVTSKPPQLDQNWRALLFREGDPWKIAIPCREKPEEFQSYLLRGGQVGFHPNVVATANIPHPVISARGHRVSGLLIEKTLEGSTANAYLPYSYSITVSNPTTQTIDGVVIRELMNSVERVIAVAPVAAVQGNELVWSLGEVPPGDKRQLRVTVVPQEESSIDTQVTLTAVSQFASASTRVKSAIVPMVLDIPEPAAPLMPNPEPIVQAEPAPEPVPGKPELQLTATPVPALTEGENLQVVFTVTNVGTANAEEVDIYVQLSDHLKHRFGKRVMHSIAKLAPGQSHQAVLRASADDVGKGFFNTTLKMAGYEQEQRETPVTIIAGEQPERENHTAAKPAPRTPAPRPQGYSCHQGWAYSPEWFAFFGMAYYGGL